MTTDDPEELDEKHDQIRAQRRRQIREWAEYVRTHPDEEWGEQVNKLVDAQLQAARAMEDERPDLAALRDSSQLDE